MVYSIVTADTGDGEQTQLGASPKPNSKPGTVLYTVQYCISI